MNESLGNEGIAEFDWNGRSIQIEHRWLYPEKRDQPLIIFLHEGLGSLSMWKDFPARLCETTGMRGLIYSRPGYGKSTPRDAQERWLPDYMHRQAYEVLPTLLEALQVDDAPWLFGHSDGGSIALLYASRFPGATAGLIVVAPHTFVEEFGLVSIRAARVSYLTTNLRDKLARYHADVDSAFWGWNDIWLDPAFESWTIEDDRLASITCPVLAVQGLDDEYGTLEQILRIAKSVPQTRLLKLEECGHSAHRDQESGLIDQVASFIASHTPT